MSKKSLSMTLSKEETSDLLIILYKRLETLDKQVERISSVLDGLVLTVTHGNEKDEAKMTEFREKVEELRAIQSVRLRFVQTLEKANKENKANINIEIQIEVKTEVDEECKNCFYFNETIGECSLDEFRRRKCHQARKNKYQQTKMKK